MHIAPNEFPPGRQTRPDDAGRAPPPWPPEIQPRQDHDDGPTRCEFDQPASRLADQKLAVQFLHHLCDPPIWVETGQDPALGRDKHIAHGLPSSARGQSKMHHRRIPRMFGQPVGLKTGPRPCGQSGVHLRIGRDGPQCWQVAKAPLLPMVNLRLEQIYGPCERQDQHHRHDQ